VTLQQALAPSNLRTPLDPSIDWLKIVLLKHPSSDITTSEDIGLRLVTCHFPDFQSVSDVVFLIVGNSLEKLSDQKYFSPHFNS